MKIVKTDQMRLLDSRTMEVTGIPSIILMEQAAIAVTKICKKRLKSIRHPKVLIVAGKGNNGGDAFAVARLLTNQNVKTTIWFLGQPTDLKGDAKINYDIVTKMKIPIFIGDVHREEEIKEFHLIVDGLFGTGLTKALTGTSLSWIDAFNRSEIPIISIDIPSGIHADTGEVLGSAVKATETITFVLPKMGLYLYPGAEYTGKISVADISIPKTKIDEIASNFFTLTKKEAATYLPIRPKRSNKSTFGRLTILAGSKDKNGAAALAAKGGYRAGAGIVFSACPSSSASVLQTLVPEAVQIPLTEEHGFLRKESIYDLEDSLKQMNAVVIGPGLGNLTSTAEFMEQVLKRISTSALLIDADGLNIMADHPEFWSMIKTPTIITPHPGEMARLNGKSVGDILDHLTQTASAFAREHNCVVVLKDAHTVVAAPDGRVYLNKTGSPVLAKAGSGDVLSGIIGAFLAQGMNLFDAAVIGVYVHGFAGELAEKKRGSYGVLANEIADFASEAIEKLQKLRK